ncbi:MAG: riboflavin biosynthesis protein RibD [Flavobacteriaceae bacterium CG_4_8_14_3_um_filter_34_10]|nr:MAG: riboflavin biosynthesis protein RibD [Flavobacteriaceae bacterium CG_4_8_14_3_um_filter_34_10]
MHTHQKYIERCLILAKNGLGTTYPNPMVGSVVVYKGQIIGEGWHQKAGQAHAEVLAIKSVKDQSLLKKATIYVSLEPCSHFGKTPPCADLIIAKKIPKVVIGGLDPNEKVAGRGVKKLLEAGCKVLVGVLEKECQELNKRFFTFHIKKRPYIILKWAQTEDGFIAPLNQEKGKPFWISNTYSKQLVHKWRSEEQAILVGTTTAIKDNPQLNVRLWEGENPMRIVLDRNLKLPKDSFILDKSIKSLIFTSEENASKTMASENVIFEAIDFEKEVPKQICDVLFKHQIQSIIIEGGAITLQSFIDTNLWDEARVFKSNNKLVQGIKAPDLKGKIRSKEHLERELLTTYTHD